MDNASFAARAVAEGPPSFDGHGSLVVLNLAMPRAQHG
jgi:hypothetical protein